MIISKAKDAKADNFEKILSKSVANISAKANDNNSYFQKRNFSEFEQDVYETVTEASASTEFEGSIELISGQKFPDIVAKQYYGIEVKSSLSGTWKSTGNSVLESTRVENVERIYLFFGQLSRPAQFKYRLYQECLFDVAVTHSPRYLIDMQLEPGNSIFDRIGIDYNNLRKKENPIAPIVEYYRRHSKKGEEPWWMGSPDEVVPVKVKLWGDLTSERKRELEIQSMARFPEIFSKGSPNKYKNLAAWLAARHGVVSPSVRDSFSAGGTVSKKIGGTRYDELPHVFSHLHENIHDVIQAVKALSEVEIEQYWDVKLPAGKTLSDNQKITYWASKTIDCSRSNLKDSKGFIYHLLSTVFPKNDIPDCVKEGMRAYMS